MKELDALKRVQSEIKQKVSAINEIDSAIQEQNSLISDLQMQGLDISEIKERYEDLKADKAMGKPVSDSEIEELHQQLANAEEDEKARHDLNKKFTKERDSVISGLTRKQNILKSELAALQETETSHIPELIRAEAEKVAAEYKSAVLVLDGCLKRILGLSTLYLKSGIKSARFFSPLGIGETKIPMFNLDAHEEIEMKALYLDNMYGRIRGGYVKFSHQKDKSRNFAEEEIQAFKEAGVEL